MSLSILGPKKMILSYLKSALSNLSKCKILRKNKNAYTWGQKCLLWVFLGYNFKKLFQKKFEQQFENMYKNVYLDELELKKENEEPCKALFLDFSKELHDSKFTTELFDL